MKHLAIAAVILWAAFHFGGVFFSSDERATEGAFGRLIEAPQRSIENPYYNGYFYLFGLTAAASLDPAKTGYEIWIEETKDARRAEFIERKATRADLVFSLPPETIGSSWDADDPLNEFRSQMRHSAPRQVNTAFFSRDMSGGSACRSMTGDSDAGSHPSDRISWRCTVCT